MRNLFLGCIIILIGTPVVADICSHEAGKFYWDRKALTEKELVKLKSCIESSISQRTTVDKELDFAKRSSLTKPLLLAKKKKPHCPPGPFKCVPWTGPTTPPARPPPPFFEVVPKFDMKAIDIGDYAEWNTGGFFIPRYDEARNKEVVGKILRYKNLIDGDKYYMYFSPSGAKEGTAGILFKGKVILE
ncbi:MAG: hypothetical protein V3T17_03520 [Pseudomonadales bacterium]